MNVGDLVRDKSDLYVAQGVVLVVKEKEYIIIKWLDTGEEVCYDLTSRGSYDTFYDWFEVISENR